MLKGKDNSKGESIRVSLPALACALLLLIPVVIAAHYNHPSFDDFAYSLATNNAVGQGPLELFKAAIATSAIYYNSWQGLYASAFLLSLQPDIFGCYGLTTYILIGSVFVGAAFLAKSIQTHMCGKSGWEWLALASFFTFFYVQGLPNPAEGLFWYNGAMNYTFFGGVLLFSAGVYVRVCKADTKGRLLGTSVVACILSLVVSGGNHVTAFANILLLGGFCCFLLLKRSGRLIAPTVFALAGFAASALAPGTAARQAWFPSHPGAVETLWNTFWHAFTQVSSWFTPALVVLLALSLPLVARLKPSGFRRSFRTIAVLAVLPFVTVWLLYCPMMYAMGNCGGGRSDDVIFLLFCAEVFALFSYCVWSFDWLHGADWLKDGKRVALLQAACVVALALPLYGYQSTSHVAVAELKNGSLQAFDAAYSARLADIEAAGEGEVVTLRQMPTTRLYHCSSNPSEEAAYLNITWKDYAASSPVSAELVERYGGMTNYYNREFQGEDLQSEG